MGLDTIYLSKMNGSDVNMNDDNGLSFKIGLGLWAQTKMPIVSVSNSCLINIATMIVVLFMLCIMM